MSIISFQLNKNLYLRDPQSSELGQKILEHSIRMIDQNGFDHFTFKKLAEEIPTTEASIYRYFENKQRLLLYLIDWYWTWLDFYIDYRISNVQGADKKLRISLDVMTAPEYIVHHMPLMNEKALKRIAAVEFEKTYLTKEVDEHNREGLFAPYKTLCGKLARLITEINPTFPFPHTLISTVLLTINHQLYYAEHLPSLTDIKYDPQTQHQRLSEFLECMIFKTITA